MRQGGMVSPLTVGRDLELHQLSLELDEARLGRGRVSVVAGEPGVGRSRLAAELQRVAQGLVDGWHGWRARRRREGAR